MLTAASEAAMPFDGAHDLLPALGELLAELRHQPVHALRFHALECLAGAVGNQPLDQRDRGHHRHREDQQQAGAEGHGRPPSTHRSSKRHSPRGVMPGLPFTRGFTP